VRRLWMSVNGSLSNTTRSARLPASIVPLSVLSPITCAGTAVAARIASSGESGTIEAGKRADLVVLDSDPLTDIHNLRTGRWVVAAGRMFDMNTLRRAVHFNR
jgi:imidazolonepropionase-like amidohydrolase